MTLLTAFLDRPEGSAGFLGILVGGIKGIIEESEANADELQIKEINVGMYVF